MYIDVRQRRRRSSFEYHNIIIIFIPMNNFKHRLLYFLFIFGGTHSLPLSIYTNIYTLTFTNIHTPTHNYICCAFPYLYLYTTRVSVRMDDGGATTHVACTPQTYYIIIYRWGVEGALDANIAVYKSVYNL